MSDRLSLSDLAQIQSGGHGFAQRSARPVPVAVEPVHFTPAHDRAGGEAAAFPDPDGDPLRAAWAEGFEAGRAESAGGVLCPDAIAEQIAGLGREVDAQTAERLERAVVALARQLLTDAPFDQASLRRRMAAALAMLSPAVPLTGRCHPDAVKDARALLPAEVDVRADPSLAPNAFVLQSLDGGVADGPDEWGRALALALARC